jgi:hypothetical protein
MKDITGQKFGKLTAIKLHCIANKQCIWLFKCECFNYHTCSVSRVNSGNTKSCGCLLFKSKNIKNINGQKFNHLTAIRFIRKNKCGAQIWLFECDCENKTRKEIILSDVKSNKSKSCGCLIARKTTPNKKKKQNQRKKIYNVWRHMKNRCYNPCYKNYHRYGGRGVIVCDEWLEGFKNFYDWTMSNGYTDGLELNRINNDGIYKCDNCNWVDRKTQMNNTSKNINITYNNQTKTLTQWAESLNISVNTLHSRLKKLNWSIEKALTSIINKN